MEFNYLCGENIRFALLVPEDKADDFAGKADKPFKQFFLESHFFSNVPALPIEEIFLHFPENTIPYGLYQPVAVKGAEGTQNSLLRSMSALLYARSL